MGKKNSPSGTRTILETPLFPPARGVEKICTPFEFCRPCCHLYIFLVIRGASSITIKKGLNCRQKKERDFVIIKVIFLHPEDRHIRFYFLIIPDFSAFL